ncbi:MAG: hypothetical protein IJ333_09790 [Clostridia bacterium]|nr:hypothetical protein [Clostridia bacterium]
MENMQKKFVGNTGKRLQIRRTLKISGLIALIGVFLIVIVKCYVLPRRIEYVETVIDYQVPFLRTSQHWNEFKLVERDRYGRCLYRYSSPTGFPRVFEDFSIAPAENEWYPSYNVNAYVIVQKYTGNYVYCYDTDCYVYVPSFTANDSILEEFKTKNSWNQPMELDRTVKLRRNSMSIYTYMSEADSYKLYGYIKEEVDLQAEDFYIDAIFTEQSKPIFVLREVLELNTNQFHVYGKAYIFTLNEENELAHYVELIGAPNEWNEQIKVFKQLMID